MSRVRSAALSGVLSLSLLGLAACVASVGWTAGTVARSLLGGEPAATAAAGMAIQTSMMFVVVLLILILMSEYLGHILTESRDRPLYYVLEERSSPMRIESSQRRNVVTDSAAD